MHLAGAQRACSVPICAPPADLSYSRFSSRANPLQVALLLRRYPDLYAQLATTLRQLFSTYGKLGEPGACAGPH